MPLTLDDCPLLGRDDEQVLKRFNLVEQSIADLLEQYPAVTEDLAGAKARLEQVRARLKQERYRCGFLGITGAGKSSAFNNILGAKEDAPSKFAPTSKATTRAITRLIRSQDKDHHLFVNYMTPNEYKAKRDAICSALKIPYQLSNAEIFVELSRLANDPAGQVSKEDVNDLRWLLESHDNPDIRNEFLKAASVRRKEKYEAREGILNRPKREKDGSLLPETPSRFAMLRDVEIHFSTNLIPKQLEIVDCPGLGSDSDVETLLTTKALDDMDGALLFLKSDGFSDPNAILIARRLKKSFGGQWGERIWIVASKFDGVSVHQMSTGSQTWFTGVNEFRADHKISASHVHIVCNELFQALPKSELTKEERHSLAEGRYGRPIDAPVYEKHRADYGEALDAAYYDGGIERLRDLLANKLLVSIRAESTAAARLALDSIANELARIEKLEKQRQDQDPEDLLDALECRNAVDTIQLELDGRCEILRDLHAKLRKELDAVLERALSETSAQRITRDQIAAHAKTIAGTLDPKTGMLFREGMVQPAYTIIENRIAGLKRVPLSAWKDPQAAWADLWMQDTDASVWSGVIPRFADKELFVDLAKDEVNQKGFDGLALRKVYQEQARLVVDRALHALRMRLKLQLGRIQSDLTVLVRDPQPAG